MRNLLLAASLALGLAARAGAQSCGTEVTVAQGGGADYTTIQAAVDAIPAVLTDDYCITIRDANTYNEEVDVRGVDTDDFRIYIGTDASGGRPVISPPAGSTAAFVVANASVTLLGVDVVADQSVLYGIVISSAQGEILDVGVSTSGALGIYEAGVRVTSYTFIDALRLFVPNAHGLWLDGSVETLVSFSSIVVQAAGKQALLVQGGEFNLFSELYVESGEGDAVAIEAGSIDNYIELSTMVAKGNADAALQTVDTGGNIITQSWMYSTAGSAVTLLSNSSGNLIDFSTIVAFGSFRALTIDAADDNMVADSYVQNMNGDVARIASGAELNSIVDSVLVNNSNGSRTLTINAASTNTVSGCRIQNLAGEAVGLFAGSDFNVIELSTIVSNAASWPAFRINSSTSNQIVETYVQNLSTTALLLETGADTNSVRRSSFVTNSAAPAARLNAADENVFEDVLFRNPSTGYGLFIYDGSQDNVVDASRVEGGLRLDGGNSDNIVMRSTMTGTLAGVYALYMQAGTGNTVMESFISHPNESAVYFWRFMGNSTISGSTITGGGSADPALHFDDSSTNTVSGSYIENPSGVGVRFSGTSVSNLVELSTITNNAAATNPAVYFTAGTASNTVDTSYIFNQSGYAVVFAATNSVVGRSTIATAGSAFPAVFANAFAAYNTLTDSWVTSPLGNAVALNGPYTTVSFSTLTSNAGGFAALNLAAASYNTVAECYVQGNSTSAVTVQNDSAFNTFSNSTMTSLAGSGVPALYVMSSDSNTFTQAVIHSAGGRAVVLQGASDNNVIARSSVSSAGGSQAAILLVGSRLNRLDETYVKSALGPGLHLDVGSNSNAVTRSTVASNASAFASLYLVNATSNTVAASRVLNGSGLGALLQQASSTTLRDTSVQGSTAVVVNGSSFTLVTGSSLNVNGTAGIALTLNGGSAHLNVATTTLVGGAAGKGLYLDLINNGFLHVGSVTVTGALQGVYVAPQAPGFTLAVDSITFRNLSAGATAVHFAQGLFLSTITLANFEDSSVAVNVHASQLNPAGTRLTMRSPRGARLGPTYENDTQSLVDWPGYELYPGCDLTYNVGFDQPYASIQSAVDALPASLAGHTCVIVRDAATYLEQVTVKGFTNNGSSLTIRHHSGAAGFRASVRPPGGSEAAFRILNASVNVHGFDVLIDQNIPYGVLASSGWVTLSSVTVSTSGSLGVTTAGISLSSWSTVSYASVTVSNVPALTFSASARGSLVTRSSFTTGSNIAAVYFAGASTNTVSHSRVHNTAGAGMLIVLDSRYNVVSESSVTADGSGYEGIHMSNASSNTVSGSYVRSFNGPGVRLSNGAEENLVSGSTVVATLSGAVYMDGGKSNIVRDSVLDGGGFPGVNIIGSHLARVERSTATGGFAAVNVIQAVGATLTRVTGSGPERGLRLAVDAANAVVSLSSFTSQSRPALVIEASTGNAVTSSFFQAASTDSAQLFSGASLNTLSNSTFAASGNTYTALRLNGASSNTLSGVFVNGNSGQGLLLENGANSNLVTQSTFATTGGGFALYLSFAGSNTLTGLHASNFTGTPVRIDDTVGSVLSLSTVSGGGPAFSSLFVSDSSTLTFHGLVAGGCADTCLSFNGVNHSRVSASSLTAAGGSRAMSLFNSSWNAVTASYLGSSGGNGLRMEFGSAFNAVSQSTLAAASASEALFVSASASNTFTGLQVLNSNGRAALLSAADASRVLTSTIVSATQEGLRIDSSTGVWVVSSYVQGSTAAEVSNSYNAFLHASFFSGQTGASGPGCALRLQGSGQTLVSSNTVSSSGDGACVDSGNYGLVRVAWNILSARGSSLRATNQAPNAPQIWISSNSVYPVPGFYAARGLHFDSLSSGATVENNSVYFRNGGGVAGVTVFGLSAQSSSGLAVRRNRFNMPNVLSLGSLAMIGLGDTNAFLHNNDVHVVVGTTLDSAVLLLVNNGSVDSRENIFSSSMTTPGVSSYTVRSTGGGLNQSNYNVYHSSNGLLSFHWNGVDVVGLPAWISQSFNRDEASTVGHPYWANTGNFVEDFHPKSTAGRYDPAVPGYVLDAVDSASIDAGNPASSYSDEPAPNGFHANAGSTGGTSEASKSPAGVCAVVRKVCKTGGCPYSSIQTAVNSIPNPLVGHSCVFIRDSSTYNESVTVASFTLAGSSITIAVDQSVTTGTPVIMPSINGHAILDIRVASVTVSGPLELRSMAAGNRDYGVYVASPSVRLSSVNVFEGAGQINVAGVLLSTESSLYYSTVSVVNSGVRAFWSTAAYVHVAYSSFSWSGGAGGGIPIFEMRGDFNSLDDVRVHANGTRDAALFEDVSDLTVTRATFTAGGGYGVLIATASDVTMTGTVMTSLGRALIIDSTADGVTIDRSSITAAAAAISGIRVAGTSHALLNAVMTNNGTGTGVEVAGLDITLSTVAVTASGTALSIGNSTAVAVSHGVFRSAFHAVDMFLGERHSITDSTMTSSGAGAGAALRMQNTSSNTVSRVVLTHLGTAGYGLYLGAASSNTVSIATITLNGGIGGVYLSASGSNTLSGLKVTNYGGIGMFFDAGASGNVVDRATVTAMGPSAYGVGFSNASSNTLTGLVVLSTDNAGMYLSMSSNWNSIARSSIAAAGGGDIALYLFGVSSNSVVDAVLVSPSGVGLELSPGSENNVFDRDVVLGGTPSQGAARLLQADENVIRNSLVVSTAGYRALELISSPANAVIEDTELRFSGPGSGYALELTGTSNVARRLLVTSARNGVALDGSSARLQQSTVSAADIGVFVLGPAALLEESYVSGSTAVYVSNPSTPTVRGNRLVGTGTGGSGLLMIGGGGLNFSSNTVTGPASGIGLRLGVTGGAIDVSSNTFLPGGIAGFVTNELDPGSMLRITSNTFVPTIQTSTNSYGIVFAGLSRGATVQHNSIVYRAPGAMTGFVTYGLYSVLSSGVRVDHNRYSNPGMVTAGGAAAFYFSQSAVDFRYNDVFSSGTLNTAPYQLQILNAPSVAVRNNIFANAMTAFSGQAVTLFTDTASQASFASDYNDFHLVTGNSRVGRWSGVNQPSLAAWQSASGQDASSLTVDPLWFSTATEDFHVRSVGGRWDPLTQSFVTTDTQSSLTVDKADPADAAGPEPFPGASRANMGSYGQTAQASKAAPPAGCDVEYTVAPGFSPDIQTAVDAVGTTLTNNPCVVIRQSFISDGNITVPALTTNDFRLTIMGEPEVDVTVDSGGLADAFVIAGASVTIKDLILAKSLPGARQVRATGSDLRLSNLTLVDGSSVTGTAVSVTTKAVIEGSVISGAGVALQVSGTGVTILYSTAATTAAGSPALRLDGTLDAALTGVYAGAAGSTAAVLANGARGTTIAASSFTSTSGWALHVLGATGTVVTGSWLQAPSGVALRFDGGSYQNLVAGSTITSASPTQSPVMFFGGSSNTVTDSYVESGGPSRVAFAAGTRLNTLSSMALVGNTGAPLIDAVGSSSNSFTGLFVMNSGGPAMSLANSGAVGSAYNTVELSTIIVVGASTHALDISGSSGTRITRSYVEGTNNAVRVLAFSHHTTIEHSTMSAQNDSVLNIQQSTRTAVRHSMALNRAGNLGIYAFDTHQLTVDLSTVAGVSASGIPALEFSGGSEMSVRGVYAQGGRGIAFANVRAPSVLYSTVVAVAVDEVAVWASGSLSGTLRVSSSVIKGGDMGPVSAGLRVDAAGTGQISVTTNTFLPGSRFNVLIATQGAGARVHVAGNQVFPTLTVSTEAYGIMLHGVKTGATVQDNTVLYRTVGSNSDAAIGIYAYSSDGVLIERNRVNQPGVVTAGSWIGIGINDTPRSHVRHNDVHGAGSGLGFAAAFAALESTGIVLTNNALSTWFTGASTRTLDLDANSAAGLRLGYNLYHSSAGPVVAYVGGAEYPHPFTFPLITDPDPVTGNPRWANVDPGNEDFHPLSHAGRWDPAAGSFTNDAWTSPGVDRADPADPVGLETAPNGSRANIGSYGGTAEASRSPGAAGSPMVSFANAQSIEVSFTDSGAPQGHVVGASTTPLFTGVTLSSQGPQGETSLMVSGLSPNVTYHMIVGALWGDAFIFSGVISTPTHAQLPSPATTRFPEVNVTSASVSWGTQANPLGVTTYTVTFTTTVFFPNSNTGNVTVSSVPSVSDATTTVSGLTPNTTYWALIGARNHAGVVSAYIQYATSTLAAPPLALVAGSPTDTTAPLSWNANGNPLGITTYTVLVSTAVDFTGAADFAVSSLPVVGAGMTPGGLTPASTYYFRLRALNHAGALSDSADAGPVVTLPLSILPPTPGLFTAGSSVTLSANWSLSAGATGYTLVASTMNVSPPVDIADSSSTVGQGSTFATVDGLIPNTTYFLFVRAHGNNGNSPYAAFTATATQPSQPLSAVTTFTAVAESSFTVSWLANANPLAMTTYTVVASTAADFNAGASSVTLSTVPAAGPSATLTALNPFTLYYVGVRALGQGTGITTMTVLGSTQTLPVSLGVPGTLTTGVSASSASATWSLVAGATGYSLVASASSINPPVSAVWVSSVAGGSSSGGAVFGLAPLSTYYLFVRAEGPGNSGSYAVYPATATDPLPPQPNAPPFTTVSFTSLDAHWNAGANPLGVTTYTVTLSTYGVFPNTAGNNQTQTVLPAGAVGTGNFVGLQVNTTYHVFVEAYSHAGARFGAVTGSTATLANPPTAGSIVQNGVSSVTVQWGFNGNPVGVTSYTVVASTAADFNAFASSVAITTASVSGVATVTGLSFGTTWHFQVQAVNHNGVPSAFASIGSTYTNLSQLIPLIVDNQSGDDVWRRANSAFYDVDFQDGSGLDLDRVQVSVSTSPGGGGEVLGFTDVLQGIDTQSYTAPLPLSAAVFNAMVDGATNYVTVRVYNHVPATNTIVDAFYVRKDTTPPAVENFEVGGDTVVQTAAGRLYDLRVRDPASGLAAFQYSVSLTPGGDASLVGWTDIAALSGATDYTTPWPVAFASLRDGATNYVSIRAWDVAGSTTQVNDAFKVFKDTTGPSVSISTPNAVTTFVSTVGAAGGSVSGAFGVSGASVAVQETVSGLYWNGTSFLSVSPVWIAATGVSTWTVASLGVPFAEGTAYRLIARGSTPYGLFSTRLATAAFTFDSTAPTVGVTSPTALATVASIPQLSGTAADAVAGVVSIEVRLRRLSDGQWWNWFTEAFGATPVSSVTAGGSAWSVTPSALLQAEMLSGSSYYIAVRANDNATPANSGDFFAQGSTFTFNDPTPPAAITDLAAVNGTLPGDVKLTWTAPGAHGSEGITKVGQYAVFASTDMLATPSTAAAMVIIPTATVIPGQFQGYIGGNGILTAGSTYFLWVALSNADGNWGAFSNQASTTATPAPSNTILGHVVNASTQGITAVRIDAYNDSGALVATAFTVADGSGTYSVTGLSAGNYKIEASWTANGITSSAWIDGIPMGSVNIDFVLNINYALATLTGTLGALSSQGQAGLGVAGSGYRPSAEGSHIELHQRGTEVARVTPDPTGRWTIGHLLPGSYRVRAFTGLSYTEFQDVDLAEGEIRTIGFVFNPLPDSSVFAFPNPARHSTTIRFETALQPLQAQIAIFDLKGALVREVPGDQIQAVAAGRYHYVWDLTNAQGQGVASGVYLFMVKVKGGSENQLVKVVKKLAVVR